MGSNPTPGATSAVCQVACDTAIKEDEEYLRELGILKRVTFAGGVAVLTLETLLDYLGSISVWEAALLTPTVIIFLTLSIFLHDSATRSPWRGHLRVESEFRKSSLIVLGAVLIALGGGLVVSSFGGGVTRVTIDMGLGTGTLSVGLYVAWRYRW